MRRKIDPVLRTVTKVHRSWLRGVHASTYGGKVVSLDLFGITTKRLEVLEEMGLIKYDGLYKLTERGITEMNKK